MGITGNELDGKTVGIVGFGNIARHLVRLLSGFRVDILAYDPIVRPDESQYPVKAARFHGGSLFIQRYCQPSYPAQ